MQYVLVNSYSCKLAPDSLVQQYFMGLNFPVVAEVGVALLDLDFFLVAEVGVALLDPDFFLDVALLARGFFGPS